MFFRRFLLGLGAFALVASAALVVMLMREPAPPVAKTSATPPRSVLVAARDLAPGSLLRADDLQWRDLPAREVPPGAFVRGGEGDVDLLGAAARRGFHAGEVLVSDQFIRPTERGFLPAVLGSGMRAVSIPVDAAGGGAGLITPGDRVDVILTQVFNDQGINAARRSVGETILRDLRVIATDQTTSLASAGKGADTRALAASTEPRLPKTVTLEVGVRQAEVLMVAARLGQVQLTLRSLADTAQSVADQEPDPAWAAEVSPALQALGKQQAATAPAERPVPPPTIIEIIRGAKTEQRCFSRETGTTTACGDTGLPAALPQTPNPTPNLMAAPRVAAAAMHGA
jgi:pilus assembly protein CpaB